jgi:hypothetical protein
VQAGDHRGNALAGKVFRKGVFVNRRLYVCVIIDKPRRYDEAGNIDSDVGVVGIQAIRIDGHDSIILDTEVAGKRRIAESIDNGAACEYDVERLAGVDIGRDRRCRLLAR